MQRCVYLSDKISGCSLCMFARGVHSSSPGSWWGQYEYVWHRMKWLMIRSIENHIQQPLPVLDSLSVCALVCMSQGACFAKSTKWCSLSEVYLKSVWIANGHAFCTSLCVYIYIPLSLYILLYHTLKATPRWLQNCTERCLCCHSSPHFRTRRRWCLSRLLFRLKVSTVNSM